MTPRTSTRVARKSNGPRPRTRGLRLVVADSQELDRVGLAALLARRPGWSVVGEAGDVAETIEQLRTHRPDVLVLALGLLGAKESSPIPPIRAAFPDVRIVAISERGIDTCVVLNPPDERSLKFEHCRLAVDCMLLAVAHGAQGVLRRNSPAEHLYAAAETVAAGGIWRDENTASILHGSVEKLGFSAQGHGLSDRELEVADHLAQGKSNRAIAESLAISEPTVKKHVGRVLLKLGCKDRLQAGLFVARHPLLLQRVISED